MPNGFVTVTLGDAWVFPMEKAGARFAFLITGLGDKGCKVEDVVTLPDAAHANAWFQCRRRRNPDREGFACASKAGHKQIVVLVDGGRRQNSNALPDDVGKVICQQPETGDFDFSSLPFTGSVATAYGRDREAVEGGSHKLSTRGREPSVCRAKSRIINFPVNGGG